MLSSRAAQKFVVRPLLPLHRTPPKLSARTHFRLHARYSLAPVASQHRHLHLDPTPDHDPDPPKASRMSSDIKTIKTDKAGPAAGPYSQAILTPHALYISGQLPSTPSGDLPSGSMAEKTTLCLTNLSAILTAAGSSLSKVVKMTVFLIDMGDFAEVNKEYEKFFQENAG